MRVRATTRVAVAVPVALAVLVLALLARRPDLAALAAGPTVLVAAAAVGGAPGRPRAALSLHPERLVEGDTTVATVTARPVVMGSVVEVTLDLPAGCAADGHVGPATLVRSVRAASESVELRVPMTVHGWGRHAVRLRRLVVRTSAAVGVRDLAVSAQIVVLPQPRAVASLVGVRSTVPTTGAHTAGAVGIGTELAEIRPWRPGDRLRDVDWRATMRDQGPQARWWVHGRHPDRSGDVVILVDSVADRGGTSRVILDRSVRAAVTLAQRVLRERDRVGVVGLGGSVRWLRPAAGLRQWYAIAEALVAERPAPAHPGLGLRLVHPSALPAGATVVVLSSLLDAGVVEALVALASRHDGRVVIAVPEPDHLVDVPATTRWATARALWGGERLLMRSRLAATGAVVVAVGADDDLADAVAAAARRPVRPVARPR